MELINQIFAKENVNSGRQMEIDLAKVVFVLMVAAVHITIDCVPEEALSIGLPYVFDSVIGGPMIAPGLMFAMGACLVYSRRQGWKDIFHRGIFIFILGFVLNLCRYTIPDLIGYAISGDTERYLDPILYQTFNNDIFQFAGLALMTIALFLKLKLKDGVMVGIALLGSMAGTLLNGVDVGSVPGNMILGYFIGVEDAAGEVLSYFVYLNWLIMPVSGYVFGKLLKRMKDKDLFYRMAVPVCLLAGGSLLCASYQKPDRYVRTGRVVLLSCDDAGCINLSGDCNRNVRDLLLYRKASATEGGCSSLPDRCRYDRLLFYPLAVRCSCHLSGTVSHPWDTDSSDAGDSDSCGTGNGSFACACGSVDA